LGIGAAGAMYYSSLQDRFEVQNRNELAAIADLKIRQIANWRKERLFEAEIVARNSFIAVAVENYFRNSSDAGLKEEILTWLGSLMGNSEYSGAQLYDALQKSSLAVGRHEKLHSELNGPTIDEILETGKVHLSDFHRDEEDGTIHLKLYVPIMAGKKGVEHPVGLLLLWIDPNQFLYPLIQSCPTSSQTAETLLVRQEGQEVVFLNDLRHMKNTALVLRHPVSDGDLPAAKAIRGKEGVSTGVDYRGVPVLAALRRVPDSPWYLVAKADVEEIHAPLRSQGFLVSVLVGCMLGSALVVLAHFWRRHQSSIEGRQRETERERDVLIERFTYFTRHANDILLLLATDGSIAEANDRAVEAYGYGHEELLSLNIKDLRSHKTLSVFNDQLKRVNGRDGLRFETVHRRKDGSEFPVEVSSRAIDLDGDRFLQSIIRDISERKEAEYRISRLNRIYALLSETNQAIVRLRDRGTLFEEVCRITTQYGKFAVAWVGIVVPGEDRLEPTAWRGLEEEDMHLIAESSLGWTRFSAPLQKGRCVVCNDIEREAPSLAIRDEALRHGCESFALVPILLHGELIGTLCVCAQEAGFFDGNEVSLLEEVGQDLSFAVETYELEAERTRAMEEFQKGEAQYRELSGEFHALLNAIPDRLALQAEDLTVLWTNQEATLPPNSTGFDLVGRRCHETWLGRPEPCEDCPVIRSFQTAEPENGRVISTDGEEWDVRTVPIRDDSGRVAKVIKAARNVTEQRTMEAQLRQAQKMEAIGTLSGGIAHDFNNILGIMLGYTEMAFMDLSENAPSREHLRQVLASISRARELVKQILTFSRQSEQEKRAISIGPIVKEALKLLRASLPSTIELRQEITGEGNILADPTQIHQVMMNLCTNAGHAMRERGGRLEVSLVAVSQDSDEPSPLGLQPGPYIRLSVKDTGHGIDPAIRHRIFDPFFTTKKLGEGTGLGLSVVHGIVKSHGGAIDVESTPGEGTIFHLFFPTIAPVPSPEAPLASPLPRGCERILLVDDEQSLVMVLRRMLERLGYQVTAMASSPEVLAVFKVSSEAPPFDLVITDMTMPHMTGLDLAREIFRLSPSMKIILCTGFAEAVSREEIEAAGIHGFLTKPVALKDLAEITRKVLDG
ncbi:MAG: response regulator, partial [Acidobacteriota bacterium]